jgi:hypothetical protein
MKEFIAFFGEWIVIVAVSGMLMQLMPEGAQKKYVQMAVSLCVLAALVGPMISVVSALPSTLENLDRITVREEEKLESSLHEAVVEKSREKIEASVQTLLAGKFGVPAPSVAVSIKLDDRDLENIVIREVCVTVENASAEVRREMKAYLDTLFLEQSEIVVLDKEKT